MKSTVLYTEEIDDLEEAAEELFEKAEAFEFKKNTLGILFADEDTDYQELYGYIRKKWDFTIIGASALAMFSTREGFKRTGIFLLIMTADDCRFEADMTDNLTADNYTEEIGRTYEKLKKRLAEGEEEKLVITYGGKVPGTVGDNMLEAMEAAGITVPVYGALASDAFNFTRYKVFYNDRCEQTVQVIVLISGNIHPKCVCVKSISNKANFSYEVTVAKGNQVLRLGDMTFLEALKKAGMQSEKTNVITDYVLSPFVATLKKDGTTVEVSRNITVLNHQDGSANFLGGIPVGSSLEIGILNRDDVQTSVKKAVQELLQLLNSDCEDETLFLCTSCAARFLALGVNADSEARSFQEILKDMNALGMYSYGEFCPVISKEDKNVNVFHNSTFTFLAI